MFRPRRRMKWWQVWFDWEAERGTLSQEKRPTDTNVRGKSQQLLQIYVGFTYDWWLRLIDRDWSIVVFSRTLKILENELLNLKFRNFISNLFTRKRSFGIYVILAFCPFILKFEINFDRFPQSCQHSYAVPGLSVVRVHVVGSWVVVFGCWLRLGPSPPCKDVKLPLRWEPLRGCGQPN